MNALKQLYLEIDNSGWDIADDDLINKEFLQVEEKLSVEKDEVNFHNSQIERQVFAFNKTPKNRLSFKLAGNQKLVDGTEIPFEWPDVKTFTSKDFEYVHQRFKEAKNVFAKTEYGLVLYYSGYLKLNDEVSILLEKLLELANSYASKAAKGGEKNYYFLSYVTVLSNAMHVAENRKSDEKIGLIYINLIQLISKTHQDWELTHKASLRIATDLTDFAIQYFKDFEENVDISAFIAKNWEIAIYLSQTYSWGAIYVADISIRLSKKLLAIDEEKKWLSFKAVQFEKLAEEAKQQNNMASVSFVEKAMNIYKGLKDEVNLHRLQSSYQELRSSFKLGEVRGEIPEDETQRIVQHIHAVIRDSTEEDIVKTLLLTPMISPLVDIRKWNEDSFKENVFLSLIPVSVQDKFGNTIASYNSDEERKKFSLLQTYEFHLQIAVGTLTEFFIEALRVDKISPETILNLLKQTWLNGSPLRKSNGRDININYLFLIESGLRSFFYELDAWKNGKGYMPNIVSATDSLVLKAEYILREFANNIGIPTFKVKPREPNLIMEKTLDDLLNDLQNHLTEDDLYFMKFILTEKAGYNLRNRIAHGLMDNYDYKLEYPVLALAIILKLSNYQFIQLQ